VSGERSDAIATREGLQGLSTATHTPDYADHGGAEYAVTDNLTDLMAVLPARISSAIRESDQDTALGTLIEVVMDLGRPAEMRFQQGEITLGDFDVTRDDLAAVADRIGQFGADNRAGIERTLHRISAIRNRTGDIVGLTCRVGRAVYGTITIISDLVESGESVLLLGRPGVGKTTMLRETARVLADDLRKRVVIVDTSNEIAGDGDIPHPAIGRARRMQVPTPEAQHAVMIEAVENHMPEVVVIDEIGTELEAGAARTIAERGVQLIGTAHGNTLENLMLNPTLSDLVGGIQSVTLSDEEARRRGTQKSILERKAPPTFSAMVEIVDRDEVIVHRNVAATVDSILRGVAPPSEMRRRLPDGSVETESGEDARRDPTGRVRRSPGGATLTALTNAQNSARSGLAGEPVPIRQRTARVEEGVETVAPEATDRAAPPAPETRAPVANDPRSPFSKGRGTQDKPLRIFPYGVSRNRLYQSIARNHYPAIVVKDARDADIVVTLKNIFRRKPELLRTAETTGTPVYVSRSNSSAQLDDLLHSLFPNASLAEDELDEAPPEEPFGINGGNEQRMIEAMDEAESAILRIIEGGPAESLEPQSVSIRRKQHQLAERYNLESRSRGKDPFRHVEIYRQGAQ
jgi:stage III sporulation protein SpoIIIAA